MDEVFHKIKNSAVSFNPHKKAGLYKVTTRDLKIEKANLKPGIVTMNFFFFILAALKCAW